MHYVTVAPVSKRIQSAVSRRLATLFGRRVAAAGIERLAQEYRPVQTLNVAGSVMTPGAHLAVREYYYFFVRGGLQHPQQTRRRNQSRQRTASVIVQTGDAGRAVADPHIRVILQVSVSQEGVISLPPPCRGARVVKRNNNKRILNSSCNTHR